MKIGVLTSSRADYSIYLPLLKAIAARTDMALEIIAFGTHTLANYGSTVNAIKVDGFNVTHEISIEQNANSPADIASSMGKIMCEFANIWAQSNYDIVFALGDRFEMFAAVSASVPFNVKIAHIHGGETTLGAIDNCFRHSISLMATLHFVTTTNYQQRVIEVIGSSTNVHCVGALSYENITSTSLLTHQQFEEKFGIDLTIPSLLVTFHPETVGYVKNEYYVNELIAALTELSNYQIIITMPNADTTGNLVRQKLTSYIANASNAVGVESFGTIGYLTCVKHCVLMLGNTSSGFVEAAYFPKMVVNIGNRQTGRILTPNIVTTNITSTEILTAVHTAINTKITNDVASVYGNGTSSRQIIDILLKEHTND